MRQGNPNKRMRGRNNNGNGGGGPRKGPNPLSRNYESNGPDIKVRGTALHVAEKYVSLARDAQAAGDHVLGENYLQHAEHYYRIIAAAQAQLQIPVQIVRQDLPSDDDFDDDFDTAAEITAPRQVEGQPYLDEMPTPASLNGEDEAPRAERPERPERADRNDRDRNDRPSRFDRPERNDRGDRPERQPRAERNDRYDRGDRPERTEQRPERMDRPERIDRGDRPERIDRDEPRGDRPERNDRNDRYGRDRFNPRDRRFGNNNTGNYAPRGEGDFNADPSQQQPRDQQRDYGSRDQGNRDLPGYGEQPRESRPFRDDRRQGTRFERRPRRDGEGFAGDRYERGDRPERAPRIQDAEDNGVSSLPAFITAPPVIAAAAAPIPAPEPAPAPAPVAIAPEPAPAPARIEAPEAVADDAEAAPKKRVTRGGRGRGRKAADAVEATDAPAPVEE